MYKMLEGRGRGGEGILISRFIEGKVCKEHTKNGYFTTKSASGRTYLSNLQDVDGNCDDIFDT